jgi:hypothetical protein
MSSSIRRWLVSRPWPQPWAIEALLYVLPGARFSHSCLYRARERMERE